MTPHIARDAHCVESSIPNSSGSYTTCTHRSTLRSSTDLHLTMHPPLFTSRPALRTGLHNSQHYTPVASRSCATRTLQSCEPNSTSLCTAHSPLNSFFLFLHHFPYNLPSQRTPIASSQHLTHSAQLTVSNDACRHSNPKSNLIQGISDSKCLIQASLSGAAIGQCAGKGSQCAVNPALLQRDSPADGRGRPFAHRATSPRAGCWRTHSRMR